MEYSFDDLDATLVALKSAGVSVDVDAAHDLILRPTAAVTPELLAVVRENKPGLVDEFRSASVVFDDDPLDAWIMTRQVELIDLQVERALRRGFLYDADELTLSAYLKACNATGRIAIWIGKHGTCSYFVRWNADRLCDRARLEAIFCGHPDREAPAEDRYYRKLWPYPDLEPLERLLEPCLERDDGNPNVCAELWVGLEAGSVTGLGSLQGIDALDIVVRYFRELLPPPLT